MFPPLVSYISSLPEAFASISPERKHLLKQLSEYIAERVENSTSIELIFICTHNSRRSHFGQIWAQTLAYHYGIKGLKSYSGGTEATAFNPNAIRAIGQAGFRLRTISHGENPLYEIRFDESEEGISAFSKVFSHPANPQENFCAIMTCSEADEACPIVPGADARIALPYEDPKAFDNSPQEAEKYAERCLQIASELAFAFEQATQRIARRQAL